LHLGHQVSIFFALLAPDKSWAREALAATAWGASAYYYYYYYYFIVLCSVYFIVV
jgi:hypothetical protein